MLPTLNYFQISTDDYFTSISFSEKKDVSLRIAYSTVADSVTNCLGVMEFSKLSNKFIPTTNMSVINKIYPCTKLLFLGFAFQRDCFVACGDNIGLYALDEKEDITQPNCIIDLCRFRGSDQLLPTIGFDQMRVGDQRVVSWHLDGSIVEWVVSTEGVSMVEQNQVNDITDLACSWQEANLYFVCTNESILLFDSRTPKKERIGMEGFQTIATPCSDPYKIACSKGDYLKIIDLRKGFETLNEIHFENEVEEVKWRSEDLSLVTSKGMFRFKENERIEDAKFYSIEGIVGMDQSLVYPTWFSVFTKDEIKVFGLEVV